MIDIHCHILHNIDDGARTAEISLNMVRQAYAAGDIEQLRGDLTGAELADLAPNPCANTLAQRCRSRAGTCDEEEILSQTPS